MVHPVPVAKGCQTTATGVFHIFHSPQPGPVPQPDADAACTEDFGLSRGRPSVVRVNTGGFSNPAGRRVSPPRAWAATLRVPEPNYPAGECPRKASRTSWGFSRLRTTE